jgi:hypothetical protein
VLLLGNFLLLGTFSVTSLSFLLLVVLGIIVLLRGDLSPSTDARSFGITRGSVESGSVVINASDIDVTIDPLPSQDRLIAGNFAANARPALTTQGTHAHLTMDRAQTSLLSFADWELGLATGMPWTLDASTSLGQLDVDLTNVIVENARFTTGFGHVRLVAPIELLGEAIAVKSVMGDIHIVTPVGYNVQISAPSSHFFRVNVDTARYTPQDDHIYLARDVAPDAPLVLIEVRGTFGDAYLA